MDDPRSPRIRNAEDTILDLHYEIERLRAAKDDLKIWMAQVLERGHLTVEIIEDARRLLRDNQQTTVEGEK